MGYDGYEQTSGYCENNQHISIDSSDILYNSIHQIMLNLEKNKFIDDNNYAISKIRLFAMQGKSKGFIKSYLIQKGIEKDILNNSLDQFEEEDPEWEKKSAKIFVRKKRLENSSENKQKNLISKK